MSNDVGKALLILQPFRHFTYVSTHSPTLSSLHLRHNSFSNPSFASPTSQLMIRAHSTTFPSLRIRLNSFSNPSVTSPTSQLIPQPFRRFTYVPTHEHSSFSNPSFASPTLQALHLRHLASRPCCNNSHLFICRFNVGHSTVADSTTN